jgi:uncharacterized membrane protein
MAYPNAAEQTYANLRPATLPRVRHITLADLGDALARGYDDFKAKPSHIIFLGILYPIVGLIIGRLVFGYDVARLLFPIAAGFSLLGPLVAIGFYELSRRREAGQDPSWWQTLEVRHSPSLPAIVTLGVVLMALFYAWVMISETLYASFFGTQSTGSLSAFLHQILDTREGMKLLLLDCAIGFLFAALIFTISVVSFPLLLDRKESAAGAVITSIRAVMANPGVMAVWAFIIAAALFLGAIPFFFGLAIVVPILGHASWHLYRKVVAD